MKNKYSFIVIAILILAFWSLQGYCLTAEEILEKVDEIRAPADTFAFDVKVTARKLDSPDLVNCFTVYVRGAEKSLVKFVSPASNKGRILLMVGQNMWIYIPGTRHSIRISPQQRLLGEVSNGDVARVVYHLDYEARALQEGTFNGIKCFKLRLKAKTKNAAYDRIILWVEKNSFKPLKGDFYAVSGKLLKTGYYKNYINILGKERPMVLEIHNELKKGQYSIMEYNNMRLESIPQAYYQKTYLKHIR